MVVQGTYDPPAETAIPPPPFSGGAAHENAAIFEFQDDSPAQPPTEGLTITYGAAGPDLWTRAARAQQWMVKRATGLNEKHDLSMKAQRTGKTVEMGLVSGWERLRKIVGSNRQ